MDVHTVGTVVLQSELALRFCGTCPRQCTLGTVYHSSASPQSTIFLLLPSTDSSSSSCILVLAHDGACGASFVAHQNLFETSLLGFFCQLTRLFYSYSPSHSLSTMSPDMTCNTRDCYGTLPADMLRPAAAYLCEYLGRCLWSLRTFYTDRCPSVSSRQRPGAPHHTSVVLPR